MLSEIFNEEKVERALENVHNSDNITKQYVAQFFDINNSKTN